MKIAVPTNDGTSISAHFGQSSGFLVFEVRDGLVTPSGMRLNGGCHPDEGQGHACHGHEQAADTGQHAGIVSTLAGCELVLCGGIGARAVEALTGGGIRPVFVSETGSAVEIVQAYVSGTLRPQASGPCRCGHGAPKGE
jgi:predicted Fe-Mo cluster-binding NifX family protein